MLFFSGQRMQFGRTEEERRKDRRVSRENLRLGSVGRLVKRVDRSIGEEEESEEREVTVVDITTAALPPRLYSIVAFVVRVSAPVEKASARRCRCVSGVVRVRDKGGCKWKVVLLYRG